GSIGALLLRVRHGCAGGNGSQYGGRSGRRQRDIARGSTSTAPRAAAPAPLAFALATLQAMSNLLAVLIGALIGLGGVVAGTWLQGRKEHQRWLRDQKLHAAIDFIGARGDLDLQRRQLASGGAGDMNEKAVWARVQDGRSALHLLCQ